MLAGRGRQVRGGRCDRLDAGFLVVGDDRHRVARFLFRCGRRLLDELHFAIDAQNLRHLLLELRIAAFQVVADLVRLDLLLIEDFAQRALSQLGEAGVSLRRPMLARMAGQQPRRPQFVGIAEVLGLAAGEVDNPCLGLGGDASAPCPAADDRRAPPSAPRPAPARRSAGPSDGAPRRPSHREKTTGLPDRPAAFAPARPGSPVPFANAQSHATSPNPLRPSPIRSPAAAPP